MKKLYCTFCSKEMESNLEGAENHYLEYFDIKFRVAPPYDKYTGKRNYVRHYYCPESKKLKWWNINKHYDYVDFKNIINN